MFAKELKIKLLARQREFINRVIWRISNDEDSDPQHVFKGHIFSEVKDEVERLGDIWVHSDIRKGIIVTVFTNIKLQREYIEKNLRSLGEDDGFNVTYAYVGWISDETLEYFRNEGFEIYYNEKSDDIFPVFTFFVDEKKTHLSQEEIEMAYSYDDSEREQKMVLDIEEFRKRLLNDDD